MSPNMRMIVPAKGHRCGPSDVKRAGTDPALQVAGAQKENRPARAVAMTAVCYRLRAAAGGNFFQNLNRFS
jgi:hypothetical protein